MVEAAKKGSKQKKGCCGGGPGPQPSPGPGPRPPSGEPDVKVAKLIFMGDKSVGKTSIIQTFIEGREMRQMKPTTLLSDFCRVIDVNVDGQKHRVKLNIWDAEGDQKLHQLAHLFVRDVQVGVLVYGINSRQSFENLDLWIEHLEEANEDFVIFLVGNKADLSEQRAVPQN